MAKGDNETEETKETKENIPSFTKEQILSSKKYANLVDALSTILSDSKMYTFDEVDKLLGNFMKSEVK